MALSYSSDKVTDKQYLPSASPQSAREVYSVTSVTATDGSLAENALIGLAVLPPNCIPTGITLICTDLDTNGSPTITLDVGILDTAGTDLVSGSLLIDGSTVAQAGGTARMDDHECAFLPATWLAEALCPDKDAEKIVTAKVSAAIATVAAGTIYCKVDYRAAENGI